MLKMHYWTHVIKVHIMYQLPFLPPHNTSNAQKIHNIQQALLLLKKAFTEWIEHETKKKNIYKNEYHSCCLMWTTHTCILSPESNVCEYVQIMCASKVKLTNKPKCVERNEENDVDDNAH